MPNVFRLDTEAPGVELVSLAPRILSPDGDGRRDSATLEISLGETARPIVLVDGDRASSAASRAGEAELDWSGTSEELTFQERHLRRRRRGARPRRQPLVAELGDHGPDPLRHARALVLPCAPRRVLRFRVSSDAERIRWRLVRRGRVVLTGETDRGAVAEQLPHASSGDVTSCR